MGDAVITDPWFYAAAVPAVLLMGLSKSGFASGFGISGAGKLILAGVAPHLRDQLQRTGMLSLIGEENIFLATETIGEAGNAALRAAQWSTRSCVIAA